jgi:hypothetical protein
MFIKHWLPNNCVDLMLSICVDRSDSNCHASVRLAIVFDSLICTMIHLYTTFPALKID